jgi:hypothetical protein
LLKVSEFRALLRAAFIDLSLDYLGGKVKIDEYVTHHRTLADINEGFGDMHVRATIRGFIVTHHRCIIVARRMYPLRRRYGLKE